MISLTGLADVFSHDFDAVIDVRSPSEYAEDHVPGAINLPVLDDAERARVGTIYKQESPFRARKIGAALVFRNAAHHVETALSAHDGGWRPLVYCWRGGQRSGAFAWMLREIGWRAETVEGGYKAFRRLIVQALYDAPLRHRLVQLGGYTGTAKTELLTLLERRGVQVLDLEDLARHRGSILGGLGRVQPSQKAFETALSSALWRLDPARPVIVEAESSKIGALNLPPSLWQAMCAAPSIEVTAPLEARARYLAGAYADVLADGAALKAKLAPLRRFRGHAVVDGWFGLIDSGDRVALCRALAADHYDPAYEKSARDSRRRVAATVATDALTPVALDDTAARIEAALQTIST
ncbi:tRNA 2-selenouridine(34) synthase MnmH [Roseovarius salis]|uniref:tRNA 2-selenouridine(34) synthase MnmH n=1 Tax=Roseovarius salis TaxID=3376063 RepID=UPI0037C65997